MPMGQRELHPLRVGDSQIGHPFEEGSLHGIRCHSGVVAVIDEIPHRARGIDFAAGSTLLELTRQHHPILGSQQTLLVVLSLGWTRAIGARR